MNVCSEPPPDGPLSDFAAEHIERWSVSAEREMSAEARRPNGVNSKESEDSDSLNALAAEMIETRQTEDAEAMKLLGADWIRLGLTDAIFRRVIGPAHPYSSLETLFGPLDPREEDLVKLLTVRLADLPSIGFETRVLAPLGIGGHVDHRLTRAAADAWHELTGVALAYYEDLPYAGDPSEFRASVMPSEARDSDPDQENEHESGSERLRPPLVPQLVPMAAKDLEAKVKSIAAYRSQISTFWPDDAAMAADVRRWAEASTIDTTLPLGILGEWRHAPVEQPLDKSEDVELPEAWKSSPEADTSVESDQI